MCMAAAAQAALANYTVAFIDTGNCFAPTRVAAIIANLLPLEDRHVCWLASLDVRRVLLGWNDDRAIDCGMLQNEEAIGHALTRIRRFATFDIYELLRVLQTLYDCLGRATELTADAPFTKQLRLLVIDSLAAVISPVLGGRANGTINTLRTSAVSSVQSLMECARQVISS